MCVCVCVCVSPLAPVLAADFESLKPPRVPDAVVQVIYISEIAPAQKRGMLVSVNEMGITVGIFVSYLINYAFISTPNGWRYMFGISMVPAIVQGVGMFALPKSPRWLLLKGQRPAARESLAQFRTAQDDLLEDELSAIESSIKAQASNCDPSCSTHDFESRFYSHVLTHQPSPTNHPYLHLDTHRHRSHCVCCLQTRRCAAASSLAVGSPSCSSLRASQTSSTTAAPSSRPRGLRATGRQPWPTSPLEA